MRPTLKMAISWASHRYARYTRAVLARPRRAALWLLVACVPALFLDAQFFGRVRTGVQDMLPSDSPTVQNLDKIHARLGGKSRLMVIAHSDDAAQNRAFVDELGKAVTALALPKTEVQWRVDRERDWIADHGALLLEKDDFDALATLLDDEVHARKRKLNPLAFDLGDGTEGTKDGLDATDAKALASRWDDLEKRLSAHVDAQDRFKRGYIESADGRLVVLAIWLRSDLDLGTDERLKGAVDHEIDKLRPRFPAVEVGYNGEVANLIEEQRAIIGDLSLSSAMVILLVGALIVLYFRSLRAVLTVVFALVPGLIFTFALGRLTVGSLNSNTAFLGSIIAGNGINYGLLLLAYYRVNPRAMDRRRSYLLAASRALPGTLGAAATASAAYGGLAAAHFRAFSEFGWIGGLGMLTTWLLTFMAMPIGIGLFDPPRKPNEEEPEAIFAAHFYESLSAPRLSAGLFAAVGLTLSFVGVRQALQRGIYETDLNALRNRQSLATGASSWDSRINAVFGIWLDPVVILTSNPEAREPAARAMRTELLAGNPSPAERVETVERFVPAPEEQTRRLGILRRAQRLLKDAPKHDLPESAQPYIDRWLAEKNLAPIAVAEVPRSLVQNFQELDGKADRTVLAYPSLEVDYHDVRNLVRFADTLQRVSLPPGSLIGSSFLFMAEVFRLVQSEAPKVILVVCLLVALALVPIFLRRARRIAVCVCTIAAVALSAQAIMIALGVRVNMVNFAAVPITIGVGSDYIVNLFGAMDAFGSDARHAAARMGGAILLCSLTTVVGYLSLVLASSGALRTFGWAAVLGEVMAVATVLLVVPALSRPRQPLLSESTQQAA